MAGLSVPTVVEGFAYNAGILVTAAMLNPFGEDAINGRSYALTLTALVTGVVLALAQANETIVGWDVGARTLDAARARTLHTVAWTAGVCAVLAALLWLGADGALAIFERNATVLAAARDGLLVSILLLPASALTTIVNGALRSAGDVVGPMVISIASTIVVLIPLGWLLVSVAGLGVLGLFLALLGAEIARGVALLVRWLDGSWARRVEDRAVVAKESAALDA